MGLMVWRLVVSTVVGLAVTMVGLLVVVMADLWGLVTVGLTAVATVVERVGLWAVLVVMLVVCWDALMAA